MALSTDQLTRDSTTGPLRRDPALTSAVVVWAALVVFTLASFLFGGEHLIDDRKLAAAVVIGIAAVKIRLVGIHFMELRHAPLLLRGLFEVYCVMLFVVIMGIYLIA